MEKLQNICPKHFFYADINFRCNGFTQISFQTGGSSDSNQFFQAWISPVAIDGRSESCKETTRLRISRADYSIKVIKRFNHVFFDTLRNKLMWGADVR